MGWRGIIVFLFLMMNNHTGKQTDCAFVLHSSICVEHVMLDWSSTMLQQLLVIVVVLTMVWAPLSKISPFTYRDSCNLPSRRRNFLYHHTSGKEMKCIFSASTSEGSSTNPNPKPHKDRKLCTAAQHTHTHTHTYSLDITWSANNTTTHPTMNPIEQHISNQCCTIHVLES